MKSLATFGSLGAKLAIVAVATVGGTALVGSSVFASLTATANNGIGGHSITSGTLKFSQASSAALTAGLTTAVAAMAPGDTISRSIDLTNGGTLGSAASSWTLGVVDTAATKLTTDPTNGLQVAVLECTSAYPVSGICGGTETAMYGTQAAPLSVNSLLTAKPLTVAAADLAATTVTHIKFIISLPASIEVSSNGSLPPLTIQGLTSLLTWTFTETQRTGLATVA